MRERGGAGGLHVKRVREGQHTTHEGAEMNVDGADTAKSGT